MHMKDWRTSLKLVAHMAREIMLNPLHINIPPLVVYLGPTFNTFDHGDVMEQWQSIQSMYEENFLEVFNAPLTGQA